jgi:signal transduction histidine kinase
VLHPYLLLATLACAICAACAGAILLQGPRQRPNQLLALLMAGASVWAAGDVLAAAAPTARAAASTIRLAAPGWILVGALTLHLFVEVAPRRRPFWQTGVAALYAASALLIGLAWTTPWLVDRADRVPWGWLPRFGPLYPVAIAGVMAGVVPGLWIARRALRSLSEGERRQLRWVALAATLALVGSTVSDWLLPLLGIDFPPLASTSMALVGVVLVGMVDRFGYSMLAPGTFAAEIVGILPDGVALVRPDQRIRWVNEGLVRLSGRRAEQLVGMHVGDLVTWSFETSEADEGDCELHGASGQPIPVSVTSTLLHDRQGHAIGRTLVVRDLREVADLRQRLITAARLAAVGELAAGIAHEINNPLSFIRSNLSQLEERWKSAGGRIAEIGGDEILRELLSECEELFDDSVEGVDRAAEIVRGVRSYAHAGSSERVPTDLSQLLEDVLHVASGQMLGRTVERDYDDTPPVLCAPQQLKQVFLNLVLNASQAMSEGGTIRVACESVDGDVVVSIEDDGCGIPPEVIDRIFDPFFTTKPVGEGTGLGLGISYQIVKGHGGGITVDSAPGRGSVFRVRLPAP